MIPESKLADFSKHILFHLKKMFGIVPDDINTMKFNEDVARLINELSVNRIK